MNLPDNPTKEQMDSVCRAIIQSKYTDGVGAIIYRADPKGGIEGRFRDRQNPRRVFEFSIKDGGLIYKAISWAEEEEDEN